MTSADARGAGRREGGYVPTVTNPITAAEHRHNTYDTVLIL